MGDVEEVWTPGDGAGAKLLGALVHVAGDDQPRIGGVDRRALTFGLKRLGGHRAAHTRGSLRLRLDWIIPQSIWILGFIHGEGDSAIAVTGHE